MASMQPPTRPALRRRYDRRRDEIIDAAAALFAARGFQATSIAELSTETGLAAGGIYHYIGNKDALLTLICDALLEPLLETADAIVGRTDSAAGHLRAILRAWLVQIESHRNHMLVFVQERHLMESGPQWRRVRLQRKQFERILEAVLVRGEEEATMRFEDRRLTLLALLGMVNYTPQWLRSRGRLSAIEIADGYADLILASARESVAHAFVS